MGIISEVVLSEIIEALSKKLDVKKAVEKDIKSSLRQLTLEKLKSLKLEWNMSISSLVYRAYSLGTISQQTLRFWMMKC